MLFFPFRTLRQLALGPRIVGRTLLRPGYGFLKTALLVAAIAAVVSYFARNRRDRPLA